MSTLSGKTRLSLLIPTYDYGEGVRRILSNLCSTHARDIEILIGDDSENDQVESLVESFSHHCPNRLIYKKNLHRGGAVANWNSLIKNAKGDYVILLHHDEFPVNPDFVPRLLEVIEQKHEKIDVFVMNCILTNSAGALMRPHLPLAIRRFVLKYLPEYILKRNVIGPVSCLVVRRDLYPLYDDKLKWLVDVDAYFRLRQTTNRWYVCSDLKIGSDFKRDESITASLKHELTNVESVERKLLISKYPHAAAWLDSEHNKIRFHIENAAWIAMRLVTKILFSSSYKT